MEYMSNRCNFSMDIFHGRTIRCQAKIEAFFLSADAM
jgi:hypothetical protein